MNGYSCLDAYAESLNGQRQNLTQFEGLQGQLTYAVDLSRLVLDIGLPWVRSWVPQRPERWISEVFGHSRAGSVLAIGTCFCPAEQDVIGVCLISEMVLAHRLSNTIGVAGASC